MKEGLNTEEKQQIATLSADGWPPSRIAKHLSRSPHTVRKYLAQPEAIAKVRNEKTELAALYRDKARACVVAIDDAKIKNSSALQLATSSGILLDKSLLLGGQPTVNVAVLIEICDALRAREHAKSEHQYQLARERLGLPADETQD